MEAVMTNRELDDFLLHLDWHDEANVIAVYDAFSEAGLPSVAELIRAYREGDEDWEYECMRYREQRRAEVERLSQLRSRARRLGLSLRKKEEGLDRSVVWTLRARDARETLAGLAVNVV
jgi:hypothetical protein